MAKWTNNFISGNSLKNTPNLANLAFSKANWQPCQESTKNAFPTTITSYWFQDNEGPLAKHPVMISSHSKSDSGSRVAPSKPNSGKNGEPTLFVHCLY